jgi:uncharacterized Zn finger protein (UPF0148 family)
MHTMTSRTSLLDKYTTKLQGHREKIAEASDPAQRKQAEYEQVEYLLDAMPFLSRYYQDDPDPDVAATPPCRSTAMTTGTMADFIDRSKSETKGKLYADYMLEVENELIDHAPLDLGIWQCDACNIPRVHIEKEGALGCPNCGTIIEFSESRTPSFEQTSSSVIVNFAYKRSNHLAEQLACFQGKETTKIPEDVIERLRAEIKKIRMSSKDITLKTVKTMLKKIGLAKYYEHAVMITHTLNGKPTPTIDAETEDKFKIMFEDIQKAFARHQPATRKNFLSYNFVIHKMAELLDRDDIAECFPFLKSKDKLAAQDQIWRKICGDLRYQYIPSL